MTGPAAVPVPPRARHLPLTGDRPGVADGSRASRMTCADGVIGRRSSQASSPTKLNTTAREVNAGGLKVAARVIDNAMREPPTLCTTLATPSPPGEWCWRYYRPHRTGNWRLGATCSDSTAPTRSPRLGCSPDNPRLLERAARSAVRHGICCRPSSEQLDSRGRGHAFCRLVSHQAVDDRTQQG